VSLNTQLPLTSGLPFQNEVNTGFGILAKTYLDVATFHYGDTISLEHANSEAALAAKKAARAFVADTFSSIKNPDSEIDRGFRFWDTVSVPRDTSDCVDSQVMVAVRKLAQEQGPKPSLANSVTSLEVIEAFEKADKWLRPIRP
jgi:hypothetical protein